MAVTGIPSAPYIAYFGYNNPNGFAVGLPVGSANYFEPDPPDVGQPTNFEPGVWEFVTAVTFDGSALTWHLDGSGVTVDGNSGPSCNP